MLYLVGTYTSPHFNETGGTGIHLIDVDESSGALRSAGQPVAADDPSFITLAGDGRFAVVANEIGGGAPGAVSSFALDAEARQVRPTARVAAEGVSPCHVSIDRELRHAYVANYTSGRVCVHPLRDGVVQAATQVVEHSPPAGHQPVPRADGVQPPRAHGAFLAPDERFLLVPDLGLDRVFCYRVDHQAGRLTPNDPPWTLAHPGAGCRHLCFSPDGRRVYLLNQLDSTVTAFEWDEASGGLTTIGTISSLPEPAREDPHVPSPANHAADIHPSPDGRFVYASNRGHDSIAVLRVDPDDGMVEHADWYTDGVAMPRNFTLTPSGSHLVVANQRGDDVITLRRDPDNGGLAATGQSVAVPAPVCVCRAQQELP